MPKTKPILAVVYLSCLSRMVYYSTRNNYNNVVSIGVTRDVAAEQLGIASYFVRYEVGRRSPWAKFSLSFSGTPSFLAISSKNTAEEKEFEG
jgi:hypothetical protein